MIREFVENVWKSEPAAVITKATNMTSATVSSERELEGKLQSIVSQIEGVVLA
jgi:hypothetical protein